MKPCHIPLREPDRAFRRQLLSGLAVTFGALATGIDAWGKPPLQSMKETPGTAANQALTSLHQEIDLKATPQRIYEVLLDSKQFAVFTGLPADIDPKVGGPFSIFGGLIIGRNVELVSNVRIVQAWRPTHWDPGVYSIVRFELKPQGTSARVVLDHTGFPKGDFDHLSDGWREHYWDGLKKYFA